MDDAAAITGKYGGSLEAAFGGALAPWSRPRYTLPMLLPIRLALVLAVLLLHPAGGVFPQETAFEGGAVPDALRRPTGGEALRYPRDLVIGELGRGDAPEDAWTLARAFAGALVRGDKTEAARIAGGDLAGTLAARLAEVGPVNFRLGGGRVEDDGSVSFLVRFLGRERSMAGELVLTRPEDETPAAGAADTTGGDDVENKIEETAQGAATAQAAGAAAAKPVERAWRVDDLSLDAARDLASERGYAYDFSPYERFY